MQSGHIKNGYDLNKYYHNHQQNKNVTNNKKNINNEFPQHLPNTDSLKSFWILAPWMNSKPFGEPNTCEGSVSFAAIAAISQPRECNKAH